MAQDDIEKLLSEVGPAAVPAAAPAAAPPVKSPRRAAAAGTGHRHAGHRISLGAGREGPGIGELRPPGRVPSGVSSYRLDEFSPATPSTETATLDLIRDVELDLKIELGRTHMYLEDVLKLRKGSVVPLDKLAGDPVDIYVNGRLIARGEVLVLNDNFCVRVAELIVGANVFS